MIETGKSATQRIAVDDHRAISFMGPELRVYSTPSILADIEMACRNLLLTMLDAGQDSVGYRVELEHLDAVPFGGQAEITVAIIGIEKRRISFEATVTSAGRRIATARHKRAVISVADLKARIANLN